MAKHLNENLLPMAGGCGCQDDVTEYDGEGYPIVPSTPDDDPLTTHPFSLPITLDPQDWAVNLTQQLHSYGERSLDINEKRMLVEAFDTYRDEVVKWVRGKAVTLAMNVSFSSDEGTDPLVAALVAREQITSKLRGMKA